jgi:hypothetical protein
MSIALTNIDCIKYIVENTNINTNIINKNGHNGFTIACKYNININVIKYLVEIMDVNVLHEVNHYCDTKWVDDDNIDDIDIVDDDCDEECNNTFGYKRMCGFKYACKHNGNDDIIKYLSEIPDIIVYHIIDAKCSNIYTRLYKLKSPLIYLHSDEKKIEYKHKIYLIKYFIEKKMFEVISHDKLKIKLYYIYDPYLCNYDKDYITYEDMKNIIDYINYTIEVNYTIEYLLFTTYIEDIDIFTKTNITELTFTVSYDYDGHNGDKIIEYYGSKLILYKCINVFNVITQYGKEKHDGLHLIISQPKYVFDEYIMMHYTGIMNIKDWTLGDLILID